MKIKWTKIIGITAGVLSIVTPILSSMSQKEDIKKLVQEELEKKKKNS